MPEPELVPADEIEDIVGIKRHSIRHYARVDTAYNTVYVLHSSMCFNSDTDMLDCIFTRAMSNGLDAGIWDEFLDQPVHVRVTDEHMLVPKEYS